LSKFDPLFYESTEKKVASPKKQSPPHHHNPSVDEEDCCNCKKSKCLKLYCQCFRAGKYCKRECLCVECRNLKEYENQRLKAVLRISARNPLAFKPRVDKLANLVGGHTEDSDFEKRVHTKGCNCKRSKCLLKYCECYQNGVACTEFCRCCNCHNTKDHAAGHCHEQKENVAKVEKVEKKKPKHKNGSSEKSHLGKRDLESYGYESINLREDLQYTK
jgi:hypothetical protein